MTITKDPRIKEFLKNRSLKENTVKKYLRHLTIYSEITGLTPSELIDQAKVEEKQGIELNKRKIGKHLSSFKEDLKARKFSPAHIQTAITNIRTFYHEYEIELPKMKLSRQDSNLETYETIPTKENIQKALEYANPKYKAIILLMVSSGMGATEIRQVTVEDFINSISKCSKSTIKFPLDIDQIKQELKENEECIATWNLHLLKAHRDYTTFSSPESVMAILDYLERKPPETIKSPLFRSEHGEYELKPNTIAKYFIYLNNKCKFGKNGRLIFFRSHALRKYFAKALFQAGLKTSVVKEFMGNIIDQKSEEEFKTHPEILLTSYQKAVQKLTIEESNSHQTEPEDLKELIDELNKNKKQLKELTKKVKALELSKIENQ